MEISCDAVQGPVCPVLLKIRKYYSYLLPRLHSFFLFLQIICGKLVMGPMLMCYSIFLLFSEAEAMKRLYVVLLVPSVVPD